MMVDDILFSREDQPFCEKDIDRGGESSSVMKLFDAHCHLQDPRIIDIAPQVIQNALDSGVLYMAVNGIHEKDWQLVKEMSATYSSIIPNFGLHPWYVSGKTPGWFESLKEFLGCTPEAAVGEIGLDKSPLAKSNDFKTQSEVCMKQLGLAKELNRPVSVHCVRAFDELLDMMRSIGPFPCGLILHSYMGSAKMVPEFTELGAYFSFSGHNMSMKTEDAKTMLKMVPLDRLLLETDSPDALPKAKKKENTLEFSEGTLNQPAYIHKVLSYVASLLEMPEEELGEISYRNAMHVFSFQGSKLLEQD